MTTRQLTLDDFGRDSRLSDLEARVASLEATLATLKRSPAEEDRETTLERWRRYHADNPQVWAAILDVCDGLSRSGQKHYGISAIWEQLRFHRFLSVSTSEPFKLANAFRAIYVRMICEVKPEYAGMFSLSRSKFDGAAPWREVWAEQPGREAQDRRAQEGRAAA